MGEMFCFQCEQTAGGHGCTERGVCGKSAETAVMQDLLLHELKLLALRIHECRVPRRDDLIADGLFSTVTNVNFDVNTLAAAARQVAAAAGEALPDDLAYLLRLGKAFGYEHRRERLGEDIAASAELLLYGLKGTAAYFHHARILGGNDPEIADFFIHALASLSKENSSVDELMAMAMECGKINFLAMKLLDRMHTEHFGDPCPTGVRITPRAGKAILISGHDLNDLENLLKQTAGTGINVYTHGEMLTAHGYPRLSKYPHLAGNYGGAWQDQKKEFEAFPGAILMTTNCIQEPRESYRDRIFTTGLVRYPGVQHVESGHFMPVLRAALAAPGFPEETQPTRTITVGYGHHAVALAAETIVKAVRAGKIRRFFLIGGCDGARTGRNYYTELAEEVPLDCVILTLACGKYRFNKMDFGRIGEIPRLLDCGQCNDAYSAIRIAEMLAEAFHCGINDLPLSIVLSWYEQKAVAVLLTLLSLGVRDIRLGPTLPAFMTPDMLIDLNENFGLMPTTTPEEDLAAMLAR